MREGQQMGVLTKKLLMLTPAAPMCSSVYGIARMDPSRRSWSSVSRMMMFFCEPAGTFGGSGGYGSRGFGGPTGRVPTAFGLPGPSLWMLPHSPASLQFDADGDAAGPSKTQVAQSDP